MELPFKTTSTPSPVAVIKIRTLLNHIFGENSAHAAFITQNIRPTSPLRIIILSKALKSHPPRKRSSRPQTHTQIGLTVTKKSTNKTKQKSRPK